MNTIPPHGVGSVSYISERLAPIPYVIIMNTRPDERALVRLSGCRLYVFGCRGEARRTV